ncbi:MAG: lactate racemase domain-containing protein, partial [Candidatus Acidiferrales bacterium]
MKNLKVYGARPFIIPAMGSHGGATAEGQAGILTEYGINEKTMGVPVEASMEVDLLGKVEPNIPVYFSRVAMQADGIVVVNRVKPHTDFQGALGSGVLKMLAIGLAKRTGASACHFVASRLGHEYVVRAVSRYLLERVPFSFGLAILENQFHQTEDLIVVKRENAEATEEKLLVRARELMPKLPFREIDLLIVDQIGKNISGAGMDPNVIGRGVQGYSASLSQSQATTPQVHRIVVCDLTPETHGNAIGIGMADFVSTRMVRALDHRSTYINALTAVTPQTAKIPVYSDTDRENIELALTSL